MTAHYGADDADPARGATALNAPRQWGRALLTDAYHPRGL